MAASRAGCAILRGASQKIMPSNQRVKTGGRVRFPSLSGKRMAMKKRMTSTPHDAVFKRFLRHPETANDFLTPTSRSDPPAVRFFYPEAAIGELYR
jgi:hypothetical protein